MKLTTTGLLIVCATLCGTVRGDEPLSQARSKAIEFTSTADGSELVAVPLDNEVYATSADDLSDLRVLTADGKTVPFLLRRRQTTEPRITRKTWRSQELTAQPVGDGRFELNVSLEKDDPQPTHLHIVTPLTNFEQQVDVYAVTGDGGEPELLVEGALIFDYSSVVDVRRDTVALPTNSARQFQIVIRAMAENVESPYLNLTRNLQGGEEVSRQEQTLIRRRPFRINRIDWIREESHPQMKEIVRIAWPATMLTPTLDEKLNRTLIEINTQRQPITSIAINTKSSNFSRRVSVEVPEIKPGRVDWKELGRGTVHRFSFRGLEEEELKVTFAETRTDTFRLVIENRDSPPLDVLSVETLGPDHEVLFLADTTQSYSLVYEADVDAPDYDLAALQRLISAGSRPVTAQLGPEQPRTDAEQAPFDFAAALNNPFLLGGIAAVLIVLLGWALFSAGKRIQDVEEPQS